MFTCSKFWRSTRDEVGGEIGYVAESIPDGFGRRAQRGYAACPNGVAGDTPTDRLRRTTIAQRAWVSRGLAKLIVPGALSGVMSGQSSSRRKSHSSVPEVHL